MSERDETVERKPEAAEIEWLTYFAANADFGPAHEDVVYYMIQRFEEKTGKRVPSQWREGYTDDEE